MIERLYINDIPISDFGVILGKDSYKSLLQYPALKSVKTNDWAEEDYIEPDLGSPVLDKRNVTLNFHAQGSRGYEVFMEYLKVHSYNSFYFPELGITLNLRVDSNTLQTVNRKWQSVSIVFLDDLPYSPNAEVINSAVYGGGGFTIDDYDFADFGVYILEGTLKSIRQSGKVKQRLLISENTLNGAVYDYNGDVKMASSDFQLKCLIRAESMQTCINNYYALLNVLKSPKTRKITVSKTSELLICYYKSATCENVHQKLASGAAGIAFTIMFTLLDRDILSALSNDSADKILTDDNGIFYFIK